MSERNRPDMDAPRPMREGVSDFEGFTPYMKAMDRSAFDKSAPETAKGAAPVPDELPASLYDRAIDLRYWGAALLGGALIWAIIFKLV